MSEQQYRVIADRDNGDDPQWADVHVGDRYSGIATERAYEDDPLVRIERPVPTDDEHAWIDDELNQQRYRVIADKLREYAAKHVNEPGIQAVYEAEVLLRDDLRRPVPTTASTEPLAAGEFQDPRMPTREQIAEALYDKDRQPGAWRKVKDWATREYHLEQADAVLDLLQNGADR